MTMIIKKLSKLKIEFVKTTLKIIRDLINTKEYQSKTGIYTIDCNKSHKKSIGENLGI